MMGFLAAFYCRRFGHGLCLWGKGYYCCERCGEKNYEIKEHDSFICRWFGHDVQGCYDDFAGCNRCHKTWDLRQG